MIYTLMFVSAKECPCTHYFRPKGSPAMVCATKARAVCQLHFQEGWLGRLRAQSSANVQVDLLFPEILARGKLNRGLLILKHGEVKGRGWAKWYLWWVEKTPVGA